MTGLRRSPCESGGLTRRPRPRSEHEGTAAMPRRVAIVGAGVAGLGAAWAFAPASRPVRLPGLRSRGAPRRQRDHRGHAAGRRYVGPVRHLGHGVHPVRVSPHPARDAATRYRPRRHPLQLQRPLPGRHLCARLGLRHRPGAAAGDREVPAGAQAPATLRPPQPLAVQVPERPQPLQLLEHGRRPQLRPVSPETSGTRC